MSNEPKKPNPGVPMSGKETVDAMADNWGKMMAFVLHKLNLREVVVSINDIEAAGATGKVICVQELDDGLHIMFLPLAEAKALAEKWKHRGFGRS